MKFLKKHPLTINESLSEDLKDVEEILTDFFLSESDDDIEILPNNLRVNYHYMKICPQCDEDYTIKCEYNYSAARIYCQCQNCQWEDTEDNFIQPIIERENQSFGINSFSVFNDYKEQVHKKWNSSLSELTSSQKERLSHLINPFGFHIFFIDNNIQSTPEPPQQWPSATQHQGRYNRIWIITTQDVIDELIEEITEEREPITTIEKI